MALLLHKRGIKRVRPLLGGLAAWRDAGLPLQSLAERIGEPTIG